MAEAAQPPRGAERPLRSRLQDLGRELARREHAHAEGLARARAAAERLHRMVEDAVEGYHEAVRAGGAPQLAVELTRPRPDEKHARAVQFDLRRGRHAALVTVKSRGEVTLVGPYRIGKDEGGCRSFPIDAEAEIEAALGDLLARFLEAAATP